MPKLKHLDCPDVVDIGRKRVDRGCCYWHGEKLTDEELTEKLQASPTGLLVDASPDGEKVEYAFLDKQGLLIREIYEGGKFARREFTFEGRQHSEAASGVKTITETVPVGDLFQSVISEVFEKGEKEPCLITRLTKNIRGKVIRSVLENYKNGVLMTRHEGINDYAGSNCDVDDL